jgi:Peptidase inhibitor I78 family
MADDSSSSVAWLDEYLDLPLDEVLELAREQGRIVRILRPGSVATADWRPARLNVFLSESGDLTKLTAG